MPCVMKTAASPGHAGVDPTLEGVDLRSRPRPVARHRSGTEPADDRAAVTGDVVERPEIEGEEHRLAIPFAEQRSDVSLIGYRFVIGGQRRASPGALAFSGGR